MYIIIAIVHIPKARCNFQFVCTHLSILFPALHMSFFLIYSSRVVIMLPLIDKCKYACQHVFSALFVLLVLSGASPPASQKPKITRKYIVGRCEAVLPEQKCVQTRKVTQGILRVLPRDFTQYGRISARQNRICTCQSMVVLSKKGTAIFSSCFLRSDEKWILKREHLTLRLSVRDTLGLRLLWPRQGLGFKPYALP